ncbi:acetylornithine deacetylase [Marinomonas ushuaiensis DSM 15871]|uniref:Acetylornithine deacetylase n=1 Tax=Marinomonas ushuaiensis DSM 15871 TaxID=1122207 RepID=X7E883_9GAMM|nr:M20/M25/M40 family metallo-hydrolase [Marinomonas ushuaiensis]ETX12177.1 acetylornithine deacetylase [Marinomonas ushuaiensis DSM 15871]
MNGTDIFDFIDVDSCLNLLSSMVQHKSYTETEGERLLAAVMHERMTELGMKSELQPVVDDRVNAIGRLKGTGGGASLLFNGHLDTNPATEGWTVDPWSGLIDDEFIYGIGVSNMKAGDAAYFCAVETILKAGIKLKGDVVLSFVVGELQAGIGTVRAIEQGLRADYFINSEPTDLQALTMHAGSVMFDIELVGDTRHLSKREEACDALAAATVLAQRINQLVFTGAETPDQIAVNRGHVGSLRAGLGREYHEWRPPQVADQAKLKGSCRYGPGQTIEGVTNDLELLLEALKLEFPKLKTSLRVGGPTTNALRMPPFEVARDSRIVKTLNSAFESVMGYAQPTGPIAPAAFFGTDAAHLSAAGMEGVVCGPGGEFNTMPDERVRKEQFLNCVRIYILCIIEICGVSE